MRYHLLRLGFLSCCLIVAVVSSLLAAPAPVAKCTDHCRMRDLFRDKPAKRCFNLLLKDCSNCTAADCLCYDFYGTKPDKPVCTTDLSLDQRMRSWVGCKAICEHAAETSEAKEGRPIGPYGSPIVHNWCAKQKALDISIDLSATPQSVTPGTLVSLQATISVTGGGPTPTGSISFYDGGVSLGSATVSPSPSGGVQGSLWVTTLSVGSHSITAVYSGDSTYSGKTSNAVVVIVQNSNPPPGVPPGGGPPSP